MEILHNFQKFRVRARNCYRSHRSSGDGYESRTGSTEVPDTGMNVLHNFRKFFVGGIAGSVGTVQTQPSDLQKHRARTRAARF